MKNILHTKRFANEWKELLIDLYSYKKEGVFIVIRNLFYRKNYIYLPLLSYTDKNHQDFKKISIELLNDNYQARVLDFHDRNFSENDMVTMRLNIFNKDYSEIYKKSFKVKCRNQIQKSLKSDLIFKFGSGNLLNDFYNIFSETMHRYGTPVFTERLFSLILEKFNSGIIIVYKDQIPVAGGIYIIDSKLMIVPWAASKKSFSKFCPNHLMYSNLIKLAIQNSCEIFDFGRSQYDGNTFKFKSQWGALPFKIITLRKKEIDIYSRYSLLSKIWSNLPRKVVNYIGPIICKYIPDL